MINDIKLLFITNFSMNKDLVLSLLNIVMTSYDMIENMDYSNNKEKSFSLVSMTHNHGIKEKFR